LTGGVSSIIISINPYTTKENNMKKVILFSGAAMGLASGAAHALEKSDLSVVSLHTTMSSYIDMSQGSVAMTLAGFAGLAAVLAYRLWGRGPGQVRN
jgi:hypothetical protein